MEQVENLNSGHKQQSILLRILNPLKSESIYILGFDFFHCSHRITECLELEGTLEII